MKQLTDLSFKGLFDLGNNALTGSVPKQLGNLNVLRSKCSFFSRLFSFSDLSLIIFSTPLALNLSNNRFSDSLPSELGRLKQLSKLKSWNAV